ncbi:MAG: ABC transporter permease [Acidobacteriota bacterium]|nr:ABC transporter permease [Acidobacteriota bacterium]
MFWRFVAESLRRAPRRKAMTVAAIAMGSAVATAMLGVTLDIGDKVNRELRAIGANILVTPKSRALPVEIAGIRMAPAGQPDFIPEAQIPRIKSIFWQLNVTAFAPSLESSWRSIPVQGVWFNKLYRTPDGRELRTGVRTLNPSWSLEGAWPDDDAPACVAGTAVAKRLGLQPGGSVSLFERSIPVAGILRTGGEEDDRILVPLAMLQRILNRPGQVDQMEVAALTKPEDAFAHKDPKRMTPAEFERWNCTNYVGSIAHEIEEVLPMTDARPIRRVADNEGRVLSKIGGLMFLIGLAALLSAGLTVWSVTAATMVERRGEIAIMQATGATDWTIVGLFAAEVALEGFVGGLLGALAGIQMARWVGRSVFAAAFSETTGVPGVLAPTVILVAVAVALAGAIQPLRRSLRMDPAGALREGV